MYGIFLYFLWRSHASHQSSNLNKVVRVAHHFVIIYSGPKFSSVVIIRSEQICFLLVVVRSVKWHKRKVRVQKLRDWDIDVCCVQTFKIHTNAFPLSRRALRLQYAGNNRSTWLNNTNIHTTYYWHFFFTTNIPTRCNGKYKIVIVKITYLSLQIIVQSLIRI